MIPQNASTAHTQNDASEQHVTPEVGFLLCLVASHGSGLSLEARLNIQDLIESDPAAARDAVHRHFCQAGPSLRVSEAQGRLRLADAPVPSCER